MIIKKNIRKKKKLPNDAMYSAESGKDAIKLSSNDFVITVAFDKLLPQGSTSITNLK